MELFEKIRLGYAAGETILGLAKKHGVHRRMVRQAIANAIPPARKATPRPGHRLDPIKPFIDGILEADKQAPRKQRHTAHRIWTRVREEYPEQTISESQVRRYVRKRKRECGLVADEIFVPQSYRPGQEAQVDWYEAIVKVGGQERKLYFFTMRSMASGDAFHCAYPHATQQALLDGHEKAFAYCPSLGGSKPSPFRRRLQRARRKLLWRDDRIPARRAHGIRYSSACGVDHEVPTSGVERGGGDAGAGSDPGCVWAARGADPEGACVEGPCAPVRVDPTAGDDQSIAAVAERQDGAPSVGGIPASEEAVLGSAPVGARILLLQFGKRDRRDGGGVYR